MVSDKKKLFLVAESERNNIDRKVIVWLNKFPERPVGTITTESHIPVDESGMALSANTNAYISKRYICGGYQAEYQFTVIYRIKPGNSMDKSLKANELLNRLGEWAMQNKPDLGKGISVLEVAQISQAELYTPYENGDEDHHMMMRITYEVI